MRFAFLYVALLGGCIPQYEPPTLSQPHATVKVRRTYETSGGALLREALLVGDHHVLSKSTASSSAQAPLIDTALVHPTPADFSFSSDFSHREKRRVYEAYYPHLPISKYEDYDCSTGYGEKKIQRTCKRYVTKYERVLRHHWVEKEVVVSDGACQAVARFAPAKDGIYLLQYDYREPLVCSLTCFEQVGLPDGSFRNSPCPVAPPPAP